MRSPRALVLLAAAAGTAAAAPIVERFLRRSERLDLPNARSSHVVPTPRGGGRACLVGGALGVGVARALGVPASTTWVAASAALATVGLLDDQRGLRALVRLGAQVGSGTLVGAITGGPLGAAGGAFVMPAVVNAVNFMDGINGITGGTAAAWGVSAIQVGGAAATQGCLTTGMALGFLPFNVPEARMFLGDVGSYLFGASIATSAIQVAFEGGRLRVGPGLVALAPLTFYLADTGCTLVRRARRGEALFEAHREHTYQLLVSERGLPHWQVSGIMASGALVAGLLARKPAVAGMVLPLLVGAYLASTRNSDCGVPPSGGVEVPGVPA